MVIVSLCSIALVVSILAQKKAAAKAQADLDAETEPLYTASPETDKKLLPSAVGEYEV